jgi:hypothetical protein
MVVFIGGELLQVSSRRGSGSSDNVLAGRAYFMLSDAVPDVGAMT